MENKALLWFKPEKIGWLFLQSAELEERKWKKLHCMIKGNKLYYIRKLNRPEPTGVLPLEGSMAEIARHDDKEPNKHCFIITMKKHINENKVHIHNNYLFATESIKDCLGWVDAVNMAAISTHIARLKLEFAQNEVQDLMARWTNLEDEDVQREVDSTISYGEENPLILQALVNELMELYHSMTLVDQSKIATQRQLYATHSHNAKLQQATILLEEEIEEKHKILIQKDVSIVNKSLKHLMSLRCSLRDIAKEIEVLDGNEEYGPEVPLMDSCRQVLKTTSKELKKLREKKGFLPKKGRLPDEGEIWKLCEQINASYENERCLLEKALPEEKFEFITQQGRHQLTSYTLGAALENQTKDKQENTHSIESTDNLKNWWSYKSLLGSKNNIMPSNDAYKTEENQNLQDFHTKSMVLPHLQTGVYENVLSNSLLKNEDKILNGKRNETAASIFSKETYTLGNSTPKEDNLITKNRNNNATNVQSTSYFLQRDSKTLDREEIGRTLEKISLHKERIDKTLDKELLKKEERDKALRNISPQIATTLSKMHDKTKNDDKILNEDDKEFSNKSNVDVSNIDPLAIYEQDTIAFNENTNNDNNAEKNSSKSLESDNKTKFSKYKLLEFWKKINGNLS